MLPSFGIINLMVIIKNRCCGFIKPPEIEIVEINDEIYVNNENFQERETAKTAKERAITISAFTTGS